MIPMLKAENFCTGRLKRGDRRCLAGWAAECEDPNAMMEALSYSCRQLVGVSDVAIAADSMSLEQCEEAWKRARNLYLRRMK